MLSSDVVGSRCPAVAHPLADLLRPLDLEGFLRDIWDRGPWFGRQRVAPAAAHELLSLSSLERVLATLHRPGDGWLHLARGGRRALPAHMIGDDGLVNLRELYTAFERGETLYLTKAERLVPPLMRMCRAIELELRALGVGLRQPVNAHVFLTPPGAQGFPPHRDEHASVVIQLDGAKAWRVYDQTTEHAALRAVLPQRGGVDRAALGAEVHSYALEAGDVLYVPAGWAHEAEAHDAHSLHVTFRIFALRWSDVVLDLAARHPALASPVPRHYVADGSALVRALSALLRGDAFGAPLARLVEGLVRERAVPSRVLPEDGLRQVLHAGAIGVDTELVHRAGVACHVFVADDLACIAFPGGIIRGPAAMAPVFRYVAATTRLRPRDLPALAGSGVRYDQVDVARTLVNDGLLRIALDDSSDDGDDSDDTAARDHGAAHRETV